MERQAHVDDRDRTSTSMRALTEPTLRLFPPTFRWGVATAAYQIEGAATEGGRGPSIWDRFAHTPGRTRNGDTGDVACDHYHRLDDDLDLLASLAVTDYRFSVSWSRLQPSGRGELNPQAVSFYRRMLDGLRDRGIRPLVTLYHWDLPWPLEESGGWPARDTAQRFADYAGATVAALGDLATDWITLNEPWCSSTLGYGTGAHAPGRRDHRAAVSAAHHLLLAHGLGTAASRASSSVARVGIANIITDVLPATDTARDVAAARRLDATANRLFLDPLYDGGYSGDVHEVLDPYGLTEVIQPGDLATIGVPTDFVGVNHYQRVLVTHDELAGPAQAAERPARPATTSFGWSVIPESLTAVLRRVATVTGALPIYVTENGASFDDYVDPSGTVNDGERVDYLRGYLEAAASAITAGVPLSGYFAWSFLDNYEWAEGYSKRFGLVFVDYATQKRTPKLSASWYRRTIGEHAMLTRALPSPSTAPSHPISTVQTAL